MGIIESHQEVAGVWVIGGRDALAYEWVQLPHNTKLESSPCHDCHLLFEQELWIQEDPQVLHQVYLGQRNPSSTKDAIFLEQAGLKSQNLSRVHLKPVVLQADSHRLQAKGKLVHSIA